MKPKSVKVKIDHEWLEESGFAAGHAAFSFFLINDEDGDEATVEERARVAYFPAMYASMAALDWYPEIAEYEADDGCAIDDIMEQTFEEGWRLAVEEWKLRPRSFPRAPHPRSQPETAH